MATVTIFLLCSFVVVLAKDKVDLEPDRPWLRVKLSDPATLKCCYKAYDKISVKFTWVKRVNKTLKQDVKLSDRVSTGREKNSDITCGNLIIMSVQLNDSGLFHCHLNGSNVHLFTHGTYLQVYKPMEKTINISESTKNKILTAEGILLLLCVLLPSATLLCKSKKLNELEKKKMKKEEENIYQGLNLDDCCVTYDKIERSQTHNPYQDVGNIMEEEEEIQLEKP